MIVTFTGTRLDLSPRQKMKLADILIHDLPRGSNYTLYHGCCIGADRVAHGYARKAIARVEGWPAIMEQIR